MYYIFSGLFGSCFWAGQFYASSVLGVTVLYRNKYECPNPLLSAPDSKPTTPRRPDRSLHHYMESAGAATTPLPSIEERFLHHTAILHRIRSAMDQMMERMDRWERSGLPTSPPAPPSTTQPTPPAASGPTALRLAPPREYDRESAECQGFLLPLKLYLATVWPTPLGEESVSVLVSCLTGRALI